MSQERIAELTRKLNARKGKVGFELNVAALEAEIARLRGE